ncbi:MAG: site-2 protease family protein [Methanomassiliicoccales archaeon]|nr:site-2 protease family protein [Methanomassiliicoccales archaeon]
MDQAAEIELVRSLVAKHFATYDVKVSLDAVVVHITPDVSRLERDFDDLRKEMAAKGYIPILEYKGGEYSVAAVRKPQARKGRNWINLALLVVTMLTTILSGAYLWAGYSSSTDLLTVDNILFGTVFFAIPLMTILGVHELSHYLMSKRHGLEASLPYFIPSVPPLGTFGAFISIREPMPSKKALVDIGVAGPIGGLLVTIPVAIIGLWLNAQGVPNNSTPPGGSIVINFPFFFNLLALLVPQPEGIMNMHPLAFAAWVGFFVTAINLLPAGQLDGGHVARGLLGDRSKYLSLVTVGVLFALGVFFYTGWLLFAALIVFLGMKHPAPLNDVSRLDVKRLTVGAVALVILVGSFVAVPMEEIPLEQTFEMHVVGLNNTSVSGGQLAFFNMTLKNTGSVNISVRMDVNDVPSTFSATLYPTNSSSANATDSLSVKIPYKGTANVTLEVQVHSLALAGKYVLSVTAATQGQRTTQRFTVQVI